MKRIFLLLGWCLTVWSVNAAPVTVGPDPRVDLLATVFRLAGNPEYRCEDPALPYEKEFAYKFDPFKSHPVVKMATELRRRYGVNYDAVMDYAVHLDSIEHLTLLPGSADTLDPRWPRGNLEEFGTALQNFAKETAFLDFYNANLKKYDDFNQFYRNALAYSEGEKWLQGFFGDLPTRSAIVPSMLPHGGFGVSARRDGVLETFAIFGVPSRLREFENLAAKQKLDFCSFVVHELSHPTVNELVVQSSPQLSEVAALAFVPAQEKLRRQAYTNADTLMIETFNRAVNIIYLTDRFGTGPAQEALDQEKANGFELLPLLCHAINEERQKSGKDWSFVKTFPQLVAVLNGPQARALIAESTRAREQMVPKVVSVTPANGDQNVNPATKVITVVFDRPMRDKSWSVCQESAESFPEVKKVSYDSSCKILTIEVVLQPEHNYLLFLNTDRLRSFVSYEGYCLDDYTYRFRTGKAAAPAVSR